MIASQVVCVMGVLQVNTEALIHGLRRSHIRRVYRCAATSSPGHATDYHGQVKALSEVVVDHSLRQVTRAWEETQASTFSEAEKRRRSLCTFAIWSASHALRIQVECCGSPAIVHTKTASKETISSYEIATTVGIKALGNDALMNIRRVFQALQVLMMELGGRGGGGGSDAAKVLQQVRSCFVLCHDDYPERLQLDTATLQRLTKL